MRKLSTLIRIGLRQAVKPGQPSWSFSKPFRFRCIFEIRSRSQERQGNQHIPASRFLGSTYQRMVSPNQNLMGDGGLRTHLR
jgi:hypothetical protein